MLTPAGHLDQEHRNRFAAHPPGTESSRTTLLHLAHPCSQPRVWGCRDHPPALWNLEDLLSAHLSQAGPWSWPPGLAQLPPPHKTLHGSHRQLDKVPFLSPRETAPDTPLTMCSAPKVPEGHANLAFLFLCSHCSQDIIQLANSNSSLRISEVMPPPGSLPGGAKHS